MRVCVKAFKNNYTVLRTLFVIQCTAYTLQRTLYVVQRTEYTIPRTPLYSVCGVQCTVYILATYTRMSVGHCPTHAIYIYLKAYIGPLIRVCILIVTMVLYGVLISIYVCVLARGPSVSLYVANTPDDHYGQAVY